MKKAIKLIDIYIIGLLVFTAACSVLRTVALLTGFNTETMHFDAKIPITVSAILAVFAIAQFGSYFFFSKKKLKLVADSSGPATYIPAGALTVALLFMSFTMLLRSRTDFALPSMAILRYIAIALALFAVLSAVSFFLNIAFSKRRHLPKAAFCLFTVIFLALYGCYLYFNKISHPTNSPNKIIDQMAYLVSAAFFLYEARSAFGRDQWKPYVFFGLTASLLTGYSSIPSLIVYFVNGSNVSDSIVESVLTLMLFIFITSKIIMVRKLPADSICKEADFIEKLATSRETELNEYRDALRAREYINVENESGYTSEAPNDNRETEKSEEAEGQISFALGDENEKEADDQ